MKIDVLLFSQTMHSLLKSSLPLQSALTICSEIFTDKMEKKFISEIHKKINEGKKLSCVLAEYRFFSPMYISLISIGEDSGTLPLVFWHLALYLKIKKNMRSKLFRALSYPILVLFTAIIVVLVLTIFVIPRLESIFEAFTDSSESIVIQMAHIKRSFYMSILIIFLFVAIFVLCLVLHKFNQKAAYILDSAILKIPFINKIVITIQMQDFLFAMKLLSDTHFPLMPSLSHAKEVLSNSRMKKSVESVCKNINDGYGIGASFEKEKVFPKYFIVWLKIAEENGETQQAFTQVCEFYQRENENLLENISQLLEPLFILITGLIIIRVLIRFVIPVFNLLGAL